MDKALREAWQEFHNKFQEKGNKYKNYYTLVPIERIDLKGNEVIFFYKGQISYSDESMMDIYYRDQTHEYSIESITSLKDVVLHKNFNFDKHMLVFEPKTKNQDSVEKKPLDILYEM